MGEYSEAKYEDIDICLEYLDTFLEKKIYELSSAEVWVTGLLFNG